jgi:hypothetical protein
MTDEPAEPPADSMAGVITDMHVQAASRRLYAWARSTELPPQVRFDLGFLMGRLSRYERIMGAPPSPGGN